MKSTISMALMLIFALCALTTLGTPTAQAQTENYPPPSAANAPPKSNVQTISVTIDDLKAFRTTKAERDACYDEKTVLTKEKTGWQNSAADWKSQFQQATYRADVVQEGRISELNSTINTQAKRIVNYDAQHQDDLQRNADLEAKYDKAKRRNWLAAETGGLLGFAGGYYLGNRYANTKIIFGGSGTAGNPAASLRF